MKTQFKTREMISVPSCWKRLQESEKVGTKFIIHFQRDDRTVGKIRQKKKKNFSPHAPPRWQENWKRKYQLNHKLR
jgi:hypothetical protein